MLGDVLDLVFRKFYRVAFEELRRNLPLAKPPAATSFLEVAAARGGGCEGPTRAADKGLFWMEMCEPGDPPPPQQSPEARGLASLPVDPFAPKKCFPEEKKRVARANKARVAAYMALVSETTQRVFAEFGKLAAGGGLCGGEAGEGLGKQVCRDYAVTK